MKSRVDGPHGASHNRAMALHVPSLPFSLDPLLAEAKRRMRRRQLSGAALALLLAASMAAVIMVSRSPVKGGPLPSVGLAHGYRSRLGWSMRYPSGMHVEHAAGSGISFGVDEVTFSSFRSKPGVLVRTIPNGQSIRTVPPRARFGTFPRNGIAVRVLWLVGPGLTQPHPARLPLQLSTFRAAGRQLDMYPGTYPSPLQHLLLTKGATRFFVQVWIGPQSSPRDRALLARVVASIAVPDPRGRS